MNILSEILPDLPFVLMFRLSVTVPSIAGASRILNTFLYAISNKKELTISREKITAQVINFRVSIDLVQYDGICLTH